MSDYYVVVADGARARFFSLEAASDLGVAGGPNLVEQNDLANSEAEAAGKELFSDMKSGRNAGPMGSGAHGYDDHRSQHMDEVERRFARRVVDIALNGAGAHHAEHLVLVAEKRMLGHLRDELPKPAIGAATVSEVAKDLTKLSVRDLHEHLAADKVLPQRRSPTAT